MPDSKKDLAEFVGPKTLREPDDIAGSDHDWCRKQIFEAQRELAKTKQELESLRQIYNKLADQWNVFQSTNRPDNRNIQRAEGAGEMARKLAEVLLAVSYDTDARDLIRSILKALDRGQSGAAGETVDACAAQRLSGRKLGE